MMKHDRLFNAGVVLAVTAAHLALLSLMTEPSKPSLEIGVGAMEVVLLGDSDVGAAQTAAPPPPPPPAPVVEKKPEKKLLTAKKPREKADIVIPKIPKEEKPLPQPEREQTLTPINAEGTGTDTGATEGAGETRAGGEHAGSGHGTSLATHLGGHLRNPKPPYPPLSIENGEEGTVRLRVVVEADGSPSSVELARSSGFPRLDRSALNTVKNQYRFTPARRLGRPISSVYTFNIVFRLENS